MKQGKNKLKITPITQSYQSTARQSTANVLPTKSSQDQIRLLRQELERTQDENQDLREEVQQITQSYLHAKSQITELLSEMERIKMKYGGQERQLAQKVQNQVMEESKTLLQTCENQKALIVKLRNQKICLSKNVWELQEKLKATRHELHLTQKQLFSGQEDNRNQKEKQEMPNVLFSPIIPKPTPKGNKVGIINIDEAELYDNWAINARSSMGKENVSHNRQAEDRVNFKKHAGGTRSGLAVAKSLAVPSFSMGIGGAGQDVKYNWLFNDETPRDESRHDEMVADRELRRKDKYMANVEDQTTQANSNFMVAHSGPFKPGDNNLTDTLPSHRQEADDVLIGGINGAKRGSPPNNRDSIVGKSLQSVKKMFQKAKEADFNSMVGRVSVSNANGYNQRVVDHETVELELRHGDISELSDNPLEQDSN